MSVISQDPQHWAYMFDQATKGDDSNLAWFWRWQMAELIWGDGRPGERQAEVMRALKRTS